MELLLWLEQVYLWRPQRKGNSMPHDKITEHSTPVSNQVAPIGMWDRAVREYERGQLAQMEQDTDSAAQSVINEIKVRSIDDRIHGRR